VSTPVCTRSLQSGAWAPVGEGRGERKSPIVTRSGTHGTPGEFLPGMVRAIPFVMLLVACGGPGTSMVQIPDGGSNTVTDGSTSSSFDAASHDAAQAGTTDLAQPPDGAVTVTSDDGFSAARTACINEINRLRATQHLAAYTIVNTDSINMCVDMQATSDETNNTPHGAWMAAEGSACDGNGQNECEGYGVDAAGIVACLDSMWNEQNQPNCAGCVGCTQFGGACPNCDFYGMNGGTCGHYVNMSATYFTQVACGFSAKGGWAAQNFYQ